MWDSRPRLSGRAKLDSRCRSDPSKFLSFRTKRGICFSPRTTTAQGEPPSAVRSSATRQPLPLRSLKILVIPNEERNLLFAADHHRPGRAALGCPVERNSTAVATPIPQNSCHSERREESAFRRGPPPPRESRPRLSGRAQLDSRCHSDPSKFLSFRTKRGICFSPRTTTAHVGTAALGCPVERSSTASRPETFATNFL